MDKIKSAFNKVKTSLSNTINKIKKVIGQNDAEIVFCIGILFILHATFLINYIIFLYVLGFILLVLGIFLTIKPNKKK